jgi:ABC-type transport system involved in multi-copper enzyme maturation permease subunit
MTNTPLRGAVACARLAFFEAVRQRLFATWGVFAALVALVALIGGELSVRQDERVLKDLGLAGIELVAVLLGLVSGTTVILAEVDRRSYAFVLSRATTRAAFVVGKFAGLAAAQGVNLVGLGLILIAGLAFIDAAPDRGLFMALFGIGLQVLLISALSMAASIWTSSAIAVAAGLVTYLAGRWSDVILNAREIAPDTPQWLWDAIYLALPNYRYMDLKDYAIYGAGLADPPLAGIALYAACYLATVLTAAVMGFEGRDLR